MNGMKDNERDAQQRTVQASRRGERLVALLVAGFALLNYPLLSVFSTPKFVLWFPSLYFYMFSAWAVIIIALAVVLRGSKGHDRGQDRGER